MTHRGPARVFTLADQIAFAGASGDHNPLHLDPSVARRTQAGALVAHGVHAVLWALEAAIADGLVVKPITTVRARFLKFIYLDEVVTLHRAAASEGRIDLEIRVGDLVAITVVLGFEAASSKGIDRFDGTPDIFVDESPFAPAPEQMEGAEGWLPPAAGSATLTQAFPQLSETLDARRVTAIALLSTVVGMACPGLNSIFSSLEVRLVSETGSRAGIGWRARRADPRYARIDLAAAGSGIEADLRALIRPSPAPMPNLEAVAAQVREGEFAGRRALIVGGSRGLGAATAMLLAAGGGQVMLTYASGEPEAAALVAAINGRWGQGRAGLQRCDVREAFGKALRAQLAETTHLYYFATPRISRQSAGVFSPAAFEDFIEIYVRRFHALCRVALDARGERNLDVLYPSSVAIAERPRGMTEYAMAKSAGETLCQDLARSSSRLAITTPRLPRVLTDQTALAIPVRAAQADEVMLPLVRAERPVT